MARRSVADIGAYGREHHITRCTGFIKGTMEQCSRTRTRITRGGGEAYVCLNTDCTLYTNLQELHRLADENESARWVISPEVAQAV